MTEGTGLFSGSLFIAGAFNNYPPVIVWKEVEVRSNRLLDAEKSGNYISWLARNSSISGLVTVVVQAILPFDDSVPPHIPVVPSIDYTFSIFVGCVVIASILGLGFAIGFFHRKGYSSSRDSLDINFEDYSESNGIFRGISLLTLTGASAASVSTIQFKECFERAMLARHLPTKETLLIINPKEIVLSKIIGEGSFGRVWSGQWQGKVVAVKEFVFAQAAIVGGSLERSNIIEEIVGEAGIMACLSHSKILQLYGCSLTMQAIWIVSELCIRGSLKMVLSNRSLNLAMTDKLAICMDVADGMHYLHTRSPPIIHRDLKSHNIFITESPSGHLVAKIGDWGSARAIALTGAKSMTQGVGTACWLSPEVINNAHFSMSSDVYAFGIVLWEVFTRQEIYEGLSAAQIIAKVAHEGLRPHIPIDCPWADIMQSCWRQDALDRPTFHHILVKLSSMYDLESTSYSELQNASDSTDTTGNASIAPKVILRQKLQAEYLGLSEGSYQNPTRLKDSFSAPQSVSSQTPTPPQFPLANFETRKYKADRALIAKRTGSVSVPEQLNFDVSDLRGPSFFIVADSGNDEDEDDADELHETSMLMRGGRNPRDESYPRTGRSNAVPAAAAAVESFANDRALHSSPPKNRLLFGHSKASGSF
jgi:serine/threonine protein kinase